MIGLASLALSLALVGEAKVTSRPFDGTPFRFTSSRCSDRFHSQWRNNVGQLITEEILIVDGNQWTQYRLRHVLVDKEVLATNKGNLIRVEIRSGAGSRTINIPHDGQILAGPLLVESIGLGLENIRHNGPVDFDYLVAERGLVLRLRATFEEEESRKATMVQVGAASPFLRAFVPKVMLTYNDDGWLESVEGRLLPVLQKGGNPVPVDGKLLVRLVKENCELESTKN